MFAKAKMTKHRLRFNQILNVNSYLVQHLLVYNGITEQSKEFKSKALKVLRIMKSETRQEQPQQGNCWEMMTCGMGKGS